MVVCVQALAINHISLVQFFLRNKIDMGYCLLTSECYEEEVGHEMYEYISDLPKNKVNC